LLPSLLLIAFAGLCAGRLAALHVTTGRTGELAAARIIIIIDIIIRVSSIARATKHKGKGR
jgi:hypothetical protein